ncbi:MULTISPECIES: imidazoleglycerol-phosphate dehydratase HisB [Methanobrevibacter]|uniref:imidazoleglycerol-phosphate dehydratase HisB n=1 Tax=Methanobrevibacter TaxID=2172 RepID=UPI0025E766ED|nr:MULTISPECIES: imidazoleglycerol-phosphate dehydratase HisB [Methanobrevibacter]MBS7258671.1 imidazoleglycerol-phosphate dehydratase HisB [Methanobrevibacter sp.]MCI7428829.1 imidazoleglycerol-phosphate dehydratase HisB [Methanobrevibacter sp.]MDY3096752.1 imidazoleglycerol-phosphate dehydratase HisB [Methanobrevibacter sp.]
MTRNTNVSRKTSETDITIKMDLDGTGKYNISTGVNFFNHMLESFSKHSMIDLDVQASGDIEIDDHHTIEDVGILLGEAFSNAIGDKKGIRRMAHAIVPMDESVATVAIDISGRSYCNMDLKFKNEKIGDMTSDIVIHFFESFASAAKLNIYGTVEGVNDHHKAEAIFKAFAKAIKDAIKVEHDQIPSTKGVL